MGSQLPGSCPDTTVSVPPAQTGAAKTNPASMSANNALGFFVRVATRSSLRLFLHTSTIKKGTYSISYSLSIEFGELARIRTSRGNADTVPRQSRIKRGSDVRIGSFGRIAVKPSGD
jgi:hypothetical protein